jgi:hypothetical protein
MRPTIMLALGLLIIFGTVTDVVAQAVTPYNIELTPTDRNWTIPVPSNTPSAPQDGPGPGPMIGPPPMSGPHSANAGGWQAIPGLGDGGPTTPQNGPGPGPMIGPPPMSGPHSANAGGWQAVPGLGDGGPTTPQNGPGPRAAATGMGGILKKASATSYPCLPPNCGASVASASAAVPGIRTLQPRTSLSSSTSNLDSLRRIGSEKMQSAVALSGGNKTKINIAVPTAVPVLAKRAIDIKTPATLPPAQISGIKR